MQIFLLLILLFPQAPVPRQSPQDRANARANAQNAGEPKNSYPDPTSPNLNLQAPQKDQRADAQNGRHDQDQTVSISKFPPVSVSKDWADWGGWIFSLVLVIVGGLQVFFLYRTLNAIEVQAQDARNESATNSQATSETLKAIQRQARAMERQHQAIIDKERARVEIKPRRLHLENIPCWGLRGDVWVRNIGASRAHINQFQMELVWCRVADELPEADLYTRANILSESFIDVTKDSDPPISPSAYFFDTESINLDWFAKGIYENEIKVHLRGILEYSTVGITYTRFVVFQWTPTRGRGDALGLLYDNTEAVTNSDRVASGYWKIRLDKEVETDTEQDSQTQNPN